VANDDVQASPRSNLDVDLAAKIGSKGRARLHDG